MANLERQDLGNYTLGAMRGNLYEFREEYPTRYGSLTFTILHGKMKG